MHMFEHLTADLQNWHAAYGERQKLQHTYLAMIVVLTVIAGLISLMNEALGHDLMFVVLAAVIAFIINAVVWNLLNSSLLLKLGVKPKRQR